ncbi:MBL fold metallo-hydrolase [Roseisolibacter sp. H3M3-2]|uniref:MBL fold metallo-hydrolase n=1 Tax=Roseisolibacter sp. H3M3-2 TaxID=3031323 RepID=UPI0023DCE6BA|nr:MBL fold metallo-hydrolase [Roseisolibacter sp. H3M3-2]MDF1502773.1 MBL fold metallo-hydrolase [Roseisolibacter sp. H3M3-2]
MQIEFSGAAREVTGSCHIVRANGKTILLDCGLFQGRRRESESKNRRLPLPVGEIDAVILSHAHIDHAGRLPYLVNEGYRGDIWATAATRDLCGIMLRDSAHIQEKDAEYLSRRGRESVEPLYTKEDAVRVQQQMIGVPYHRWFDVLPGVRARFTDAGHILGSASVVLEAVEDGRARRLVFSGDVGRSGLPIIRDPEPPTDGADAVILESTYGDRDHPPYEDARERLAAIVRDTAARGGRVLIPAFAVGRTQELVYDLHELYTQDRVPRIPIVIDSPLAVDATGVFAANPEVYDRGEALVNATRELFQFGLVRYVRDVQDSKALNAQRGPMVVISASGMAESGRILHHLMHGASDPRNTILIVGFQAEHTLGRRIVERRATLRILGEDVPLRARVEVLNGYSAHGDRADLARWLDAVGAASPAPPPVYLVHGEQPAQEALRAMLTGRGFAVQVPAPGDVVTV